MSHTLAFDQCKVVKLEMNLQAYVGAEQVLMAKKESESLSVSLLENVVLLTMLLNKSWDRSIFLLHRISIQKEFGSNLWKTWIKIVAALATLERPLSQSSKVLAERTRITSPIKIFFILEGHHST